MYRIYKINPSGTLRLKDSDNNILPKTFKDYELQFVGTSLEEIKNPKERREIEKAEERALARNRLARTGLDTNNIIRSSQLREGRRIGEIMKPKKKKEKKKKPVEKWAIEKLIRRFKAGNNQWFYEVKWVGWDNTTIEPRSNLIKDVPDMVEEFEAKN